MPAGSTSTGERPDSVDVQLHGLRGSARRASGPTGVQARVSLAGIASRRGDDCACFPSRSRCRPASPVRARVQPSRVRLVLGDPALVTRLFGTDGIRGVANSRP